MISAKEVKLKEKDYLLIQDFKLLSVQQRFELILDIYNYNGYNEEIVRIIEFATAAIIESKNWNNESINYLNEWLYDPNYTYSATREERTEEDRATLYVVNQFGYQRTDIIDTEIEFNFELNSNRAFDLPRFTYKWLVLTPLVKRNINNIYYNQFEAATIGILKINTFLGVIKERLNEYNKHYQDTKLEYERYKKENSNIKQRDLIFTRLEIMIKYIEAI